MKLICLLSACFFFLLLPTYKADAQMLPADSAFYSQAVNTVLDTYKNEFGENQRIYNGSEYATAGHNIEGFPYFKSDGLLTGSILYDGNLYEPVKMRYDLVTDALVINNYTNNFSIKLVPEKIDHFSIAGHLFVYIHPDDTNIAVINPGIYEKLYSGKVSISAKRTKELKLPLNAEDQQAKYVEYNKYYIEAGGIFYQVDNESSLLTVLGDKKDQLKKYIRQNKMNFKKDFEASLIKTAEYYSLLKN